MEHGIEQRILRRKCRRFDRAEYVRPGALPNLIEGLDWDELRVGIPELKMKFDRSRNVWIVVIPFPLPACSLDQRWPVVSCHILRGVQRGVATPQKQCVGP